MKRKLLYTLALVAVANLGRAQVFFSQNFDGATLATLQSATPNNGQVDALGANLTATIAVNSNKLELYKGTSGTANGVAYLARTTDLGNSTSFFKVEFTLKVSGSSTANNSAAQLIFGSGLTADGVENIGATNLNGRIGITTVAVASPARPDGGFQLRDIATSTNSTIYLDEQPITIFYNATAEPQTYTALDGSGTKTLPAGNWNAWVGTALQFSTPNRAVSNAGVQVKNFKIIATGGTTATYAIDNLVMTSLSVVLPVSLTSFSGKWENGAAQLRWQTAAEQNNSHFDILRSTDGKKFVKIATIQGNGTTSQTNNYSYTDHAASSGTNYYKLSQVDFDGKSKEYDAIPVKNPLQSQLLTAFLNASGEISVKLNSAEAKSATLGISNVQGKRIATHQVKLQEGENQFSLPFAQMPSGVYILSVDGAQAQKFLKK